MKPFWLFVIAGHSYACSPAVTDRIKAANEAGRLLCEAAPQMVKEASLRGVSVEELCAVREVIDRFASESLAAQDAACKAALPSEEP